MTGHDTTGRQRADEVLHRVFRELFKQARPTRLEAYPDAAPALGLLRARGLTLGAISNMGQDLPLVLEDHPNGSFPKFW